MVPTIFKTIFDRCFSAGCKNCREAEPMPLINNRPLPCWKTLRSGEERRTEPTRCRRSRLLKVASSQCFSYQRKQQQTEKRQEEEEEVEEEEEEEGRERCR